LIRSQIIIKNGDKKIREIKLTIISKILLIILHQGESQILFISVIGIFPRKETSVLFLIKSKEFERYLYFTQ